MFGCGGGGLWVEISERSTHFKVVAIGAFATRRVNIGGDGYHVGSHAR